MLVGKRLQSTCTLPEGEITLPSHLGMLRQIVTNLLANAIKFTDEGSVDLRLVCDPDDRPRAIEVEDTGIGIPEGECRVSPSASTR